MRPSRSAPIVAFALLALLASACSTGAAGPSQSAAAPSSAAPSATASTVTLDSAEAAAQLVMAQEPLFAGFGPLDPDMIGQCCWYEAKEAGDGYEVLVHAGWGDCPSGCINKHEWTFTVSRAGAVELTGETGDPIPAGGVPQG